MQLRLFDAEFIDRLQNDNFEHQNDIEGLAACVPELLFVTNLLEGRTKNFPRNNLFELRQKIIDWINFGELVFEVEEGGAVCFIERIAKRARMEQFCVILSQKRKNRSDLTFDFGTIPSQAPAPTPEPATLLILGIGVAGTGIAALRRRKN